MQKIYIHVHLFVIIHTIHLNHFENFFYIYFNNELSARNFTIFLHQTLIELTKIEIEKLTSNFGLPKNDALMRLKYILRFFFNNFLISQFSSIHAL